MSDYEVHCRNMNAERVLVFLEQILAANLTPNALFAPLRIEIKAVLGLDKVSFMEMSLEAAVPLKREI